MHKYGRSTAASTTWASTAVYHRHREHLATITEHAVGERNQILSPTYVLGHAMSLGMAVAIRLSPVIPYAYAAGRRDNGEQRREV